MIPSINQMEILQAYLAGSILRSLFDGAVVIIALLILENIPLSITHRVRHHIYKVSMILLLFTSVAGEALVSYSGKLIQWIPYLDRTSSFIELINYVWLAGVGILAFRWLLSEALIRRLRTKASSLWPTAWKKLIDQCYASIHSGFRPRLLHHQGVGSAFVAGMIRPVVIFPTAWVNRLSAEEAECVLLHELAHLNARDHMMNLVCAISEILLFFNPASHFIIGRIRIQREICADESVIRKTQNPVSYARLLVNLGESTLPSPALTFGSVPRQLTIRIKEILQPGKQVIRSGSSYALVVLCLFGAWTVGLYQPSAKSLAIHHIPQNEQCNASNEILATVHPNRAITTKRTIAISRKMSNIKLSNPSIELNQSNPTVEDEFVTNDDAQSTDYGIDLSTQDRFSIPHEIMNEIHSLRDSVHAVILFDNDEAADHDAGSTVRRIQESRIFSQDKEIRSLFGNPRKAVRYIMIKDQTKTIMSYSSGYQQIYQISTIN
ncbi:MAG: M56 family metallopeptidase [Saprospiraceae bacterium]|mgnify:CR=1 FL=1